MTARTKEKGAKKDTAHEEQKEEAKEIRMVTGGYTDSEKCSLENKGKERGNVLGGSRRQYKNKGTGPSGGKR